MEKIQENICKQACLYVFVQENYIKAHVLMYFLHLVLTFTPHYIIMVKGPLHRSGKGSIANVCFSICQNCCSNLPKLNHSREQYIPARSVQVSQLVY